MKQTAFTALIAVWVLWALPFVVRRTRGARKQAAVMARTSVVGVVLQMIAYAMIWSRKNVGVVRDGVWLLLLAFALGAVALVLVWWAIPALGRQWRVQAGLNADHKLIQSGPYRLVRHPMYASMLALLLSTGLLVAEWRRLAIAAVIFVIGQEIRVRAEEGLLVARFGKQYEDYRKRVWAYVPFIR